MRMPVVRWHMLLLGNILSDFVSCRLISLQVDRPFAQKLFKPFTDEGFENTLQSLLEQALPDLVKGMCDITQKWWLMLCMLSENFSWHIEIFFLIFPRKQAFIFHTNCLFRRLETAWNVRVCFTGKNKQNIISLSSAAFAQRVGMVKGNEYTSKGNNS